MDKKRLISFLLFVLNIYIAAVVAIGIHNGTEKIYSFIVIIAGAASGLFGVWFPDWDYGDGTWGFSNRTWVRTPPVFISAMGWIFLLLIPIVWFSGVWKN